MTSAPYQKQLGSRSTRCRRWPNLGRRRGLSKSRASVSCLMWLNGRGVVREERSVGAFPHLCLRLAPCQARAVNTGKSPAAVGIPPGRGRVPAKPRAFIQNLRTKRTPRSLSARSHNSATRQGTGSDCHGSFYSINNIQSEAIWEASFRQN